MSDLVEALQRHLANPTEASRDVLVVIVRERLRRGLKRSIQKADRENIAQTKALKVTMHLMTLNEPAVADEYVRSSAIRAGIDFIRKQKNAFERALSMSPDPDDEGEEPRPPIDPPSNETPQDEQSGQAELLQKLPEIIGRLSKKKQEEVRRLFLESIPFEQQIEEELARQPLVTKGKDVGKPRTWEQARDKLYHDRSRLLIRLRVIALQVLGDDLFLDDSTEDE